MPDFVSYWHVRLRDEKRIMHCVQIHVALTHFFPLEQSKATEEPYDTSTIRASIWSCYDPCWNWCFIKMSAECICRQYLWCSLREKCPKTELLVRSFLYLVRIFLCSVNLRIQTKYRKIQFRNNSIFGHLSSKLHQVTENIISAKCLFQVLHIVPKIIVN